MKISKTNKTKLFLTELGFGCGAIGGLYRAVDHRAAFEVLETAWKEGIRYFDTAPFYGHGLAERRLGDFLQSKKRNDFVLSTKVGKLLSPVHEDNIPDYGFVGALPFEAKFDYSYAGIMRSFEDSLQRMGMNRIDILYVHDLEPASFQGDEYHQHLDTFLSSGIEALNELKRAGDISAFGLGVNDITPCIDVLNNADIDLLLLAGRYTLLDRTAEAQLLPLCKSKGVEIVVGGVFNSGILATGAIPAAVFNYQPATDEVLAIVREMESVCAAKGAKLASAALHFPLLNDSVVNVLIGTAKVSSLKRNIHQYHDGPSLELINELSNIVLSIK